MKQNNAERVIGHYITAWALYARSDTLRMQDDYTITSCGTPIGKIIPGELNQLDEYVDFLVLTAQDFKSQPSWRAHKRALAKAANNAGLLVVFVPQLDIGFGLGEQSYEDKEIYAVNKLLLRIAKYSTDPDIKTAAACFKQGDILALSYNQFVNDTWHHAEQVLVDYALTIDKNTCDLVDWQMLLEPCTNCLSSMIKVGAQSMIFSQKHKQKWDTDEYIDMTQDIFNGKLRSPNGHKICLRKLNDLMVDKFYKESRQ